MGFDLTNVWFLAQKEIKDARRNKWLILYALVFSALASGLSWLGLSGIGNYGVAGFGRTAASLINLVLLIAPLMGLTLGASSFSREREQGSLLFILAHPVTKTEVLFGKYLGLALALLSALGLGFGVSGLLIVWQGVTTGVGTYMAIMGLAFYLVLISLGLGFLISSIVRKGTTALGVSLFLWLFLVFLSDLGLMSTSLAFDLEAGKLFTLAVLNPLQSFKMSAILTIRGSLEVLGPAGLYALRTFEGLLLPFLLLILGSWTVIPLLLSYFAFRRKGAL